MDQFLDSIADAVSQLVLLSESDNSLMFVNLGPGAQAVIQATGMLVGIGEEIEGKFSTADMKSKMREAIDGIQSASREIQEAVALLSQDQFSTTGRKKLAKAAKIILSSTVMTLQLTDLFECVKLIKQAKTCLHLVRTIVGTTLYSEFTQLAQALAMDSIDLAQLVMARIGFIIDPVCKRKLEENNNLIRCQIQTFIQGANNVFQNPSDPSLIEYRNIVSGQLETAIEEIINAARLSSKTMLEACSLDMRMLDAEGKLTSDIREFAEDVGLGSIIAPDQLEGVQDLRSLLGSLIEAARNGDVQTVLSTLDQLQAQRASSAPSVARAVLAEEIAVAVRQLAFEMDEMALQSLQDLVDFSMMGLDALSPPPLPNQGAAVPAQKVADIDRNAAEKLFGSITSTQGALQRLQSAVSNGATQEAAAAAKEMVAQLTTASKESEELGNSCNGLQPGPQLLKLSEEAKSHAPILIAKTKAALTDSRNQLVKEDFDLEVDKVHETMTQIKTVVDKALKKGGKADEIKKQIAETTKEIDDLIELMMEAAKTGSTAAVADSARQLDQLNKRKTMLVQKLKECEEDTVMQARIASDDDSLCALLPPLMEVAKQVVANPNDPALLEKMRLLGIEAKDLSALLDSHTHPNMDPETIVALMENAANIQADLQALQNAAQSGQPQAVVAAARSLMQHVDQQAKIAATLREQSEDSALSRKVAAECDSLSPLVPSMVAFAKLVLQNANDPDALQRLSSTIKQGHSANARVVETFLKLPSSISNDLNKLRAVVMGNNASNDEITEALEPLKISLAQQSKLARAMAAVLKVDDMDAGQRLLKAADDMNECLESLSDLLQEALDNPFATLDAKKVDDYIQRAMQAHQIVVQAGPKSMAAELLAARKQAAVLSSASAVKTNPNYDDELLQALEAVSVNEPTPAGGQPVPVPVPVPISFNVTPAPKPLTYEVLQGAARSVEAATVKFQAAQAQVAQQAAVAVLKPQEEVVGFAKLQSKFAESDGTLWGAARVVAAEMHKLSCATKTVDMITAAREIANAVAEICALAQAQADLCADQKLRDQLLTVAVGLRNYSVQLKIVSAVKAASDVDEVSSAQSQLVSCGKNVADGVIKIIDYSRIAALKKKKV